MSLWRAPTDNDDPPGDWRFGPSVADAWRAAGLDRLEVVDRRWQRRRARAVRETDWAASTISVRHRQTATLTDAGVRIDDRVDIDGDAVDLPRVGVSFRVPQELSRIDWFGPGPGDTYPDRRAAASVGHWHTTVTDQTSPFLVPQEFGLHMDMRWFTLSGVGPGITVRSDDSLSFSALPYSSDQLTAATHAHLLVAEDDTEVHIDVAHRGLGSAACGPDTDPAFTFGAGTYRWTWYLDPT